MLAVVGSSPCLVLPYFLGRPGAAYAHVVHDSREVMWWWGEGRGGRVV